MQIIKINVLLNFLNVHTIAYKGAYAPLGLRSSLVPVAAIGSSIGPYMAIFGLMFSWPTLVNIGIVLFSFAVGFYLITLPAEFNASKRAVVVLSTRGGY